ncbi:hypothetical protein Ndes2526B_g08745 [Nannochloris sp. 'desiccata']
MMSLLLSSGPKPAAVKAIEDFDFNHSMNSNEDAVLADAIFGKCSDDSAKRTSEGARREPSVSGRPAGKSVEMPAHEAEKAADPAHAMDSDAMQQSLLTTKKINMALRAHMYSSSRPAPLAPPRARCVLVAKCLTNSDASSGRIILPRVAVEANLPFVTAYRHYALAVRDSTGRRYEFVIKSWANGTEHRRVFVLEQASEFLRAHNVGVGDTVGICTDEYGELVVEANTEEVKYATVCPRYGTLAMAAPPRGATAAATSAVPLAAVMAGRCARSVHCTKAAGHPGFCSGPKAAAAAAAAAAQAHAAGAAAVARFRRKTHTTAPAYNDQAHMVVPTAVESSEIFAPNPVHAALEDASAYSSDETAATNMAPSRSLSHRIVIATQKGEHSLPEGLHTIAYVPAGLRISKTLTAYDISSKRVILPAEDLEAGVPNCGDADVFTLAAVDESQTWQFPTLRAWHTVAGRRGYLLEAAAEFLSSRAVVAGDTLVVYRDADVTPPRIEVRTGTDGVDVRRPQGSTEKTNALTFSQLPMLLHPEGRRHHDLNQAPHHLGGVVRGGTTTPRSSAGTPGAVFRTTTTAAAPLILSWWAWCWCYTLQQDWWMHQSCRTPRVLFWPQGLSNEGKAPPTGTASFSGFRGGHPLRQHRVVPRSSSQYQQFTDEEGMSWNSDDDDYTPAFKRPKRGAMYRHQELETRFCLYCNFLMPKKSINGNFY